jgi:ABC-2 type transport system ATP-binding protein
MSSIEARGLTKRYGELTAVDRLELSVDNEIYGLLGPNGSGKTTTVNMLTTLLSITEGSASVCGHDVLSDGLEVRESISYVPQDMAVDIRLSGRENVDLFAKLYGIRDRSERRRRVDEVLGVMNLTDRADDRTKTYSGGMRRRLELAQALVHEPKVLFLDEPTVGLDVAARRSIWEHIVKLRNTGVTIFVTTHQMDEAERYCDRVGILKKGVLSKEGTPDELTRHMKTVVLVRTDGGLPTVMPEGVGAVKFEDGLAVFTADDGQGAVPALMQAYAKDGIKVFSTSVREPTLEDVYMLSVGPAEEGSFDASQFRNIMRRR